VKNATARAPREQDGLKTILARLHAGAATKEFLARRTVFAQGDRSDAVYYIEKGRVQLSAVSRQGKEAIVSILSDGGFFGEACLTGQTVTLATAKTLTVSTLARIPRRTMVRMLARNSAFADYFLSYVLMRNLRVEEELMAHLFNSSEKRLARLLLRLAYVGRGPKPLKVTPKIDQQTLARMIGTTRERVSQFMNKFRRLGLIEYNGELRVHSALINVILHS
jgi:CRP/FNR family transcriptional regulator, cyclic AMP receptor protein